MFLICAIKILRCIKVSERFAVFSLSQLDIETAASTSLHFMAVWGLKYGKVLTSLIVHFGVKLIETPLLWCCVFTGTVSPHMIIAHFSFVRWDKKIDLFQVFFCPKILVNFFLRYFKVLVFKLTANYIVFFLKKTKLCVEAASVTYTYVSGCSGLNSFCHLISSVQ